MEPSPRYLFKPNQKWIKENKVFFSSNFWGFRGKNFQFEKQEGQVRIIILGASTTEGFLNYDDETYPYYLENLLKEQGLNVEVLNAGHHGQDINDLLAIFKKKNPPAKT